MSLLLTLQLWEVIKWYNEIPEIGNDMHSCRSVALGENSG